MASADELIREAQYAFRNISFGSTDEKKYRAIAEKYAKLVMRKYPVSIEAAQARQILDQMNVRVDVRAPLGEVPQASAADNFAKSHALDSGHTKIEVRTPPAPTAQNQHAGNKEDWRNLIRRFMVLPGSKKKFLGIIAVISVLFPGGIFAVSGLIIFYALRTEMLKKHLDLLLTKLESR